MSFLEILEACGGSCEIVGVVGCFLELLGASGSFLELLKNYFTVFNNDPGLHIDICEISVQRQEKHSSA